MKTRLYLGAVLATLACSSCNLLPESNSESGTASATVNYQDETGPQLEELSISGVSCDVTNGTGSYLTVNSDSSAAIVATVSDGKTLTLTITFGRDNLVFSSTQPFEATDEGATFTDLPGEVIVSDGGDSTYVDEAATASGSIHCP